MGRIEIFMPRYHDNVALIAQKWVKDDNIIYFTQAKHLNGKEFRVSGDVIRSCPLGTNGKIPCYEVPMKIIEEGEINE